MRKFLAIVFALFAASAFAKGPIPKVGEMIDYRMVVCDTFEQAKMIIEAAQVGGDFIHANDVFMTYFEQKNQFGEPVCAITDAFGEVTEVSPQGKMPMIVDGKEVVPGVREVNAWVIRYKMNNGRPDLFGLWTDGESNRPEGLAPMSEDQPV